MGNKLYSDNFVVIIRDDRVDNFVSFISPLSFEGEGGDTIDVSFRVGLYPIQPEEDVGDGISKAGTAFRETRREGVSDVVRFSEELIANELEAKKTTFMFYTAPTNKKTSHTMNLYK